MNLPELLSEVTLPDETEAEQRTWTAVRAAQQERLARRRRWRWRRLLAPGIAVLLGVALTPAGASVRHWLGHALELPQRTPSPLALPAPGALLVSGAHGTWKVARNGAIRRLGAWTDAAWSPHGRYIAVSGHGSLTAITPNGAIQWGLPQPAVSDIAWFGPSGYRIAYRAGAALRIVAGDGTGDHLLASRTAPVTPAWRPGHPYQLAYVTGRGRLVVSDADTGRQAWAAAVGMGRLISLAWSGDGSRLLVVAQDGARLYDHGGRVLQSVHVPARAGALSPDGRRIALVLRDRAVLVGAGVRPIFVGRGLGSATFSPDGRWLLITWPAADEWIFVHVAGAPRILTVARATPVLARAAHIAGWCCSGVGAGAR